MEMIYKDVNRLGDYNAFGIEKSKFMELYGHDDDTDSIGGSDERRDTADERDDDGRSEDGDERQDKGAGKIDRVDVEHLVMIGAVARSLIAARTMFGGTAMHRLVVPIDTMLIRRMACWLSRGAKSFWKNL